MGSGRRPTITIEGKTIREISAETGIREATLRARIFPGCTIKDITTRVGTAGTEVRVNGMMLREIAEKEGISYGTIFWRYRHGRTDYESLTSGRYRVRMPRANDTEEE